jgi:hypothetical protein
MRVMIADTDPISLARYSVIPSLLQAITTSMWICADPIRSDLVYYV